MNYQSTQRDDDMLDIGDETTHASTQEDTSTYNNDLGELHQGIGQDLKQPSIMLPTRSKPPSHHGLSETSQKISIAPEVAMHADDHLPPSGKRTLPPLPPPFAVERAKKSAAAVEAENLHLDSEALKDRFRFCQQKIDCCLHMIQQVTMELHTMNHCYKALRRLAPSMYEDVKLTIPREAFDVWDPVLEILNCMRAGEDLSLEELKEAHDVFEALSPKLHDGTHYDHIDFCEYIYMYG